MRRAGRRVALTCAARSRARPGPVLLVTSTRRLIRRLQGLKLWFRKIASFVDETVATTHALCCDRSMLHTLGLPHIVSGARRRRGRADWDNAFMGVNVAARASCIDSYIYHGRLTVYLRG
jgi:hypothetical protein